ncbi:hypothetical protein WISP_120259 [Willisornis vidua]|uniref:AF10 protein n=1 Tax=Willisornis vidua TaxID=1566151 RepID=A0ABQ9CSY2_9PASS|nr:hypothetical protein WISP_120259 [Willisornis vidua]
MVSSEPLLLPVSLEGEFSSSMKEMIGGCCVCSDERGWAENPLVYCDGHGCNVAVHQACYGIVQVPTGPWFCRKCESQERAARVGSNTTVWNTGEGGEAVAQSLGDESLGSSPSCCEASAPSQAMSSQFLQEMLWETVKGFTKVQVDTSAAFSSSTERVTLSQKEIRLLMILVSECNGERCELCPHKDGALKRTDNGEAAADPLALLTFPGWAHVVCALYIPEVQFANVSTMEPIVLQSVPHDRYNKTCYICDEQGRESKAATGACMTCNKHGCRQAFHVTCAQFAGLLCEEEGNGADNVQYCGYCKYHFNKLKKSKRGSNRSYDQSLSDSSSHSQDKHHEKEKKKYKEKDKHKQKYKKQSESSPSLVPSLTVTTEKCVIIEALPPFVSGSTLASGTSVLELAGIVSAGHGGSSWQLLTEATPVAPPPFPPPLGSQNLAMQNPVLVLDSALPIWHFCGGLPAMVLPISVQEYCLLHLY